MELIFCMPTLQIEGGGCIILQRNNNSARSKDYTKKVREYNDAHLIEH